MHIIFKRQDGGVSITTLCLNSKTHKDGLDPDKVVEHAEYLLKTLEPKCISYRFVDSLESVIPSDRYFRNAWTDDHDTDTVDVNIEQAKELHKNKLRLEREEAFKKLDVDFMKALEASDSDLMREITAKKKLLRDITKHPDLEAASTPEEIKAVQLPKEE